MDNWWLEFVKVFQGTDDLADHNASFPFGYGLLLLQVKVQIVAFDVLQHCRERVGINLKDIVQLDDAGMRQVLVDVIFSQRMPEKERRNSCSVQH